jgi:hypothetical protein
MRACMVDRQGNEWWTDDERETAAEQITVVSSVQKPTVTNYTYVGDFTTKHHTFRRYQEVVTDAPQ